MSESAFEVVIGLEIHIQLSTNSKIFAPEAFAFGKEANHQVSLVSMAHPGALPRTNEGALRSAIKIGLALGCPIQSPAFFDRKNYFYPDLPKGYQISQDTHPICGAGTVQFPLADGSMKEIRIHHIHLEEDAGKSIHDLSPTHSMVDLNRAGAGLLEMVTEPDLRSPEEAAALLQEMRRIVRYLGISDGNMQEGNLRCDANISLRPWGQEEYGTRVEIKNINSFSFLSKALDYETERQSRLLQEGGTIIQETRTFNAATGITSSMRDKESADDYRYFPEPDLLPLHVTKETIETIRGQIPILPSSKYEAYQKKNIPHNEALTLIEDFDFSRYYDELAGEVGDEKEALNWMMGPVRSYLNEHGTEINDFPLSFNKLGELLLLLLEGKVNRHIAREKLFPLMMENPEKSASQIANDHNFLIQEDGDALKKVVSQILDENPKEKERFLGGQRKLQGFFVGKIMKAMQGKADPKRVNQILAEVISESKN